MRAYAVKVIINNELYTIIVSADNKDDAINLVKKAINYNTSSNSIKIIETELLPINPNTYNELILYCKEYYK